MAEVRPVNLFADYLSGRQAALGERSMRQQNALLEMDMERQQRVNALSQNPNATPEQYIRAGQPQIGNALSGQQESKQQALGQLGMLAQKALQMDPTNRRPFIKQAVQAYAPAFQSLGVDLQRGLAEFDSVPDMELDQRLQQLAGFAEPRFRPGTTPSAIQVYEYMKGLPPEEQARMMETMRAPMVREIGGVQTVIRQGGDLQPLSTVDQEATARSQIVGAESAARETGKAAAQAAADLPRLEGNAQEMITALDRLEQAPLHLIYGAASLAPVIPGTPQADAFAMWEQIQGKAFLEAFGTLKGGGQITEKEGEKATAAITRLSQRKMSPSAAKIAIRDLKEVVRAGVERARKRAPKGPTQVPQAPTATGPNGEKLILRNGQWVPVDG